MTKISKQRFRLRQLWRDQDQSYENNARQIQATTMITFRAVDRTYPRNKYISFEVYLKNSVKFCTE